MLYMRVRFSVASDVRFNKGSLGLTWFTTDLTMTKEAEVRGFIACQSVIKHRFAWFHLEESS
jgi:hypothetical protein